jgi:hypothetical protein
MSALRGHSDGQTQYACPILWRWGLKSMTPYKIPPLPPMPGCCWLRKVHCGTSKGLSTEKLVRVLLLPWATGLKMSVHRLKGYPGRRDGIHPISPTYRWLRSAPPELIAAKRAEVSEGASAVERAGGQKCGSLQRDF